MQGGSSTALLATIALLCVMWVFSEAEALGNRESDSSESASAPERQAVEMLDQSATALRSQGEWLEKQGAALKQQGETLKQKAEELRQKQEWLSEQIKIFQGQMDILRQQMEKLMKAAEGYAQPLVEAGNSAAKWIEGALPRELLQQYHR